MFGSYWSWIFVYWSSIWKLQHVIVKQSEVVRIILFGGLSWRSCGNPWQLQMKKQVNYSAVYNIMLEKLIVTQLVKKFCTFMEYEVQF